MHSANQGHAFRQRDECLGFALGESGGFRLAGCVQNRGVVQPDEPGIGKLVRRSFEKRARFSRPPTASQKIAIGRLHFDEGCCRRSQRRWCAIQGSNL